MSARCRNRCPITKCAADDMLDEQSSPIAQQFTQMIDASTHAHRQQIMDELNGVRQAVAAAPASAPMAAALIALPPIPVQAAAPVPAAGAEPPNNYWFMNQPAVPSQLPADQTVFAGAQVVQPGADNSTLAAASAMKFGLARKFTPTAGQTNTPRFPASTNARAGGRIRWSQRARLQAR